MSTRPVIPVAAASAEPDFSPEQLRALRCLVGEMIPASAQYQVPGADDETIFADIVATLRPHARLAADALDALAQAAGGCLADLQGAARADAITAFRAGRAALRPLKAQVTVQCFYPHHRPLLSLRTAPAPPFPPRFAVDKGVVSLHHPVQCRPPLKHVHRRPSYDSA